MPRPRRKAVSAAYARRNARARALGFESYYDYRAHDHGRRAPSEPRSTGAALRRLRGHASRADLLDQLGEDKLLAVGGTTRGADGRYRSVSLTLVNTNGDEREFTLRGKQLERAAMRELVDALESSGVVVDPYLARLAADEAPENEERVESA
jgi:hypothetical protein